MIVEDSYPHFSVLYPGACYGDNIPREESFSSSCHLVCQVLILSSQAINLLGKVRNPFRAIWKSLSSPTKQPHPHSNQQNDSGYLAHFPFFKVSKSLSTCTFLQLLWTTSKLASTKHTCNSELSEVNNVDQ